MRKILFLLMLGSMIFSACQGGQNGAAQAVEDYYQAMVERDEARYTGFTCTDWEEQALLEYDSFSGVEIALDGLSCQETGADGDTAQVTCAGQIVATYGNEQMDFPLADRVHSVVNENGDWRVCGY
jgi:hypothetical protein